MSRASRTPARCRPPGPHLPFGRMPHHCQPRLTDALMVMHCATGAAPGTAFRGHPKCHFCSTKAKPKFLYDEDALHAHLGHDHFSCDLCTRATQQRAAYYGTYADLRDHFQEDHYACPVAECVAAGHVVFRTEVDLAVVGAPGRGGQAGEWALLSRACTVVVAPVCAVVVALRCTYVG